MILPVVNLRSHRLRGECRYLGISTAGMTRVDMINELKNAGMNEVDTRFQAKPPKIDTSDRSDDMSNLFLGNGAGLYETRSNQLYIANDSTKTPLIHGDFKKKTICISDVLQICSSDVHAETCGEEGDLRRDGSNLFMFRTTNVESGWYPISFGIIKLV